MLLLHFFVGSLFLLSSAYCSPWCRFLLRQRTGLASKVWFLFYPHLVLVLFPLDVVFFSIRRRCLFVSLIYPPIYYNSPPPASFHHPLSPNALHTHTYTHTLTFFFLLLSALACTESRKPRTASLHLCIIPPSLFFSSHAWCKANGALLFYRMGFLFFFFV